ncbi:MAG: glycosyltransferase family 4 protein [Cyanobacteria bacterium J06634_6]
MKVLQINFSDYLKGGGSAIAMHRLHEGLKHENVESKILCGTKTLNTSDSVQISRNFRLERFLERFTSRIGLNDIHGVSSFQIPQLREYQEADILHFHLIHSGFFSYLALPKLTQHKPAVFTLHDMWSFTGHCAYSYDCERWQSGCGQCPYPNTQPAVTRDSTRWEWKLKDWAYQRSNLTVVADSRWLAELAKASMLNHFPVHHIPYGLDVDVYRPMGIGECRSVLGIPADKHVLMFSAVDLKDRRKGGDLLTAALQNLPEEIKARALLLILGEGGETIAQNVGIPTYNLGYVSSDRLKAVAYSAADLFLFPTRFDAFGIVAQEAAACGTPTVSFKVGGVPDIVRPGITGYLATPENIEDFCHGIVHLLDNVEQRLQMGHQCRMIAETEYSLEIQAKRYLNIYHQILKG